MYASTSYNQTPLCFTKLVLFKVTKNKSSNVLLSAMAEQLLSDRLLHRQQLWTSEDTGEWPWRGRQEGSQPWKEGNDTRYISFFLRPGSHQGYKAGKTQKETSVQQAWKARGRIGGNVSTKKMGKREILEWREPKDGAKHSASKCCPRFRATPEQTPSRLPGLRRLSRHSTRCPHGEKEIQW